MPAMPHNFVKSRKVILWHFKATIQEHSCPDDEMLMRNDSTTTTTTTVGQRVTVINLTRRGGNAAIAITPGVWINEDDGNWNMLIATTRRSDYYPGTACAGHQTNKQTLPGRRRRRRKRKEPMREWEEKVEIICSLFVGIYVEISTWKAQWRDPRDTSEVRGGYFPLYSPTHPSLARVIYCLACDTKEGVIWCRRRCCRERCGACGSFVSECNGRWYGRGLQNICKI